MHDGFDDSIWLDICDAILTGASLVEAARRGGKKLADAYIANQMLLRKRAAKRFADPDRCLWTNQLLEQASDEHSAGLTASYFPRDATIFDLCCGAGADAVSLSRRGNLTAVDHSTVAVALTKVNLALNACRGTAICNDATLVDIPKNAWVHVDPDRRSSGSRTTSVEWFEPGVDFLAKLISQSAAGSIKVAPGTRLPDFIEASKKLHPHPPLDDILGVQFISLGGSVRQQRWWWNVDKFPPKSTTVSVMQNDGKWLHWNVREESVEEFPFDCMNDRDELTSYLGGFIGDADGAVRAASLQPRLAESVSAKLLDSPNGYFLRREPATNEPHGLIDWFKIEAVLPFDRKKLRSYLRKHRVGTLEIKSRRIEVPIEALRKELRLAGDASRTLLVTKCDGRAVAIVAQRVTKA